MAPPPTRDWFRKATWSDLDAADFERRLARARERSRAQYVRIQAGHLARSPDLRLVRIARDLLTWCLADYPDNVLERGPALEKRASCRWRLGETNSAIDDYRAAFIAEDTTNTPKTNGWLKFGWTVVTERRTELYAEVDVLFEARARSGRWSLIFPVDVFQFHVIRARIAEERGQLTTAATHARVALTASALERSGLRHHPSLGLVGPLAADLHQSLAALAATAELAETQSSPPTALPDLASNAARRRLCTLGS